MPSLHLLFFDIDGTLLSSGGAGKAALESALLAEFGLPSLRGQVIYSGRTDRAICHDLLRLHGLPPSPENCRRLIASYLERLPACLTRHAGQVLTGIVPLLEQLGRRPDVVLALLTGNLRAGARVKLGHFGLNHHFRFGGFGDDYLDRDEVARAALAAARQHLHGPVDISRVWVIGDTPLDVRCARAIGARAVAVATGGHTPRELAAVQPDLLLEDFADPAPLLSRLGPC